MNYRILSVILFFIASIFIGRGIVNTETVQAQSPVIPSYLELLSMQQPKIEKKQSASIDTIEVSYNINTQEVSVKGTTDAVINVMTTGEIEPVVKWKTKLVKENIGFPKVYNIANLPEDIKPIPFISK